MRATAPGRRGASARSSATDGSSAVDPSRVPHARAAAGGQGDRHPLRLGRRGQDDDRGRRGGDGRRAPRRQGAGAHRRPGPAAGQRARARAVRQRREARCRPRRSASGGRAARRAVGGDARHEAVVGRPGAPPRTRRRSPATPSSPTRSTRTSSGRFVQSHDYIAMERLYEIHTAGTYDLIVVDTPPTRNAIDFLEAPERMADFFSSRLLRWLTVPARSRVVNVGVAGPSTRSPIASSVAVPRGHRRVLPAVPDDVRRASSSGPRPSTALLSRPAHDVRRRVARSRPRRCARPSSSSTRSTRAASTSARSCSTRCCPTTSSTPAPPASAERLLRRARPELAEAARAATPATATQVARVLARSARASSTSGVVAKREAEQRAELAARARRGRHRALLRHRHLRPRRPPPAGRGHLAVARTVVACSTTTSTSGRTAHGPRSRRSSNSRPTASAPPRQPVSPRSRSPSTCSASIRRTRRCGGWWEDEPDPAPRARWRATGTSTFPPTSTCTWKRCSRPRRLGLPVLLGLEVDHYAGRMDEVAPVLAGYPFDVLLGSVHWIGGWGFDILEDPIVRPSGTTGASKPRGTATRAALEELAASGVCDVLAHPDLPKVSGRRPAVPDEWYDRMAEAAASSGMAAEVSSAGWRKPVDEVYPAPALLSRFRKRDVPITTASDAHELPNVAARRGRSAPCACRCRLRLAGGLPRPPPAARSPSDGVARGNRARTRRSRGPRSPIFSDSSRPGACWPTSASPTCCCSPLSRGPTRSS